MDATELLTTRASNGKLMEPAPDAETLDLAFAAAARAPDHANLKPWRFLLIRGAGRDRLGAVMREMLATREPDAPPEALDRMAGKPLRAPLIIVVVARLSAHPKVPELEQLLSAGAAAQNILLALHARGFAGIWRTGDAAYDTGVRRALGLADHERIVGFLYAGTARLEAPALRRPHPESLVEEWSG
jgi:nitroreductase